MADVDFLGSYLADDTANQSDTVATCPPSVVYPVYVPPAPPAPPVPGCGAAGYLLDLLARTTDKDGWLDPLLADPDSEAVICAMAQMFARVGLAVQRNGDAGLIYTAPAGNQGLSTITLKRAASGTAGTIPAGYPFIDARGIEALAVASVAVGAGVTTVDCAVATVRRTELVNTVDDPVFAIDPSGATVLDVTATSVLIAPAGTVGLVATSFQIISSSTPIDGGASNYLGAHGRERGQFRQVGEAAEDYRRRVRNISESISPFAIAEAVAAAAAQSALLPLFNIVEPFEDGATPSLKAAHNLGSFGGVYAADGVHHTDFFDDAGVPRYLVDNRSAIAYFRVEPATYVADLTAMFYASYFLYSGYTLAAFNQVVSAMLAIYEEADRKRAAGVQFDVCLSPPATHIGVGHSPAAIETVVFTLNRPGATLWYYVDGQYGHDFALSNPTPPNLAAYHKIRFTFFDATTFTTAAFHAAHTERRTVQDLVANAAFPYTKGITKIEGLVESDGAQEVNLVGTFYLVEVG